MIEIRDVTQTFVSGKDSFTALRNVNLTIADAPFPNKTVSENVAFGLQLLDRPKHEVTTV